MKDLTRGYTDQPKSDIKCFFNSEIWTIHVSLIGLTYIRLKGFLKKVTRILPFGPHKIAKHPRRAHSKTPLTAQNK